MFAPLSIEVVFLCNVKLFTLFSTPVFVNKVATTTKKGINDVLSNSFLTKSLTLCFFLLFYITNAKSPLSNAVLSESVYFQAIESREIPWYVWIVDWIFAHPWLMLIFFLILLRFGLIPTMKAIHWLLCLFYKPLQILFERLPLSYRRNFRKSLRRIRKVIDGISDTIKRNDGVL